MGKISETTIGEVKEALSSTLNSLSDAESSENCIYNTDASYDARRTIENIDTDDLADSSVDSDDVASIISDLESAVSNYEDAASNIEDALGQMRELHEALLKAEIEAAKKSEFEVGDKIIWDGNRYTVLAVANGEKNQWVWVAHQFDLEHVSLPITLNAEECKEA